MTYKIGFVSQKGGCGKSTLARLLAREIAVSDMTVKIADMDVKQATSSKWVSRRLANEITPSIRSETFGDVKTALAESNNFDFFIFDGAPHASVQTKEIAKASDLVVLPTGQGLDDLEPTVLLAHELFKSGISINKIVFALMKVTDSDSEISGARDYLSSTPYKVLKGAIPYKTSYSKALDIGKSINEVSFKALHEKADELAQSIVDAVAEVS